MRDVHQTKKANHRTPCKQARRPIAKKTPTVLLLPDDPVDRLLATDFVLVRLGREIRKHQSLLRESCSEEAWRIYLRIEELMNERMYSFADKWVATHPKKDLSASK